MNYSSYYYHGGKHMTKPRKTDGNIKGLELEISDYDAGDFLDNLIEDNILTVPSNENTEKDFIVTVEEDGSVYRELVFKACCNSSLLKSLKPICDEMHGNICNGHGTSCHIHINNDHLEKRGISQMDIVKSAEFLAPIMFRYSGRNLDSMSEWCQSAINLSIRDTNLYERASHVDNRLRRDNGRYAIVNVGPINTTEIRLFSNYYNFDYDYIKMYIETIDFIIDLAEYMVNKSYVDEFDNIIELIKNFYSKRKYKEITERHQLYEFFLNAKEFKLKVLVTKKRQIKEEFGIWKSNVQMNHDYLENEIRFLRMLRRINYDNVEFDLIDLNAEDLVNNLINKINNEIEELEEE